jgi:hypothetical protein
VIAIRQEAATEPRPFGKEARKTLVVLEPETTLSTEPSRLQILSAVYLVY